MVFVRPWGCLRGVAAPSGCSRLLPWPPLPAVVSGEGVGRAPKETFGVYVYIRIMQGFGTPDGGLRNFFFSSPVLVLLLCAQCVCPVGWGLPFLEVPFSL